MASTDTRIKLVSYEVKKLFGSRDVRFDLDPLEPTLLTGSNGSGKSTILRSIDAVCTGRWTALEKLPFESITLRFSSGPAVKVTKAEDGFKVSSRGQETWNCKSTFARYAGLTLRERELRARRGSKDLDLIRAFNRALAYGDSHEAAMYGSYLNDTTLLDEPAPAWIRDFPSRLPVLFVTDQRLLIEPPSDSDGRRTSSKEHARAAVDHTVDFVHGLMTNALSDYASESQRLDRDFPQRVVAAMRKGVQITDDDLQTQLQENDREARLLQRVGLLPEDVETQAFTDFQGESVKPVIATHAADTAKKLTVLRPLRQSLALFAEFLNQHYRTKQISFDPRFGYRIVAEDTSLTPAQLSSGEQQILVLAFQVLFKAEPGTLLLIDEPELSLHVTWQSSFIHDMTRMGAQRHLSFLLATHSPSLTGGRDDLRRNIDAV